MTKREAKAVEMARDLYGEIIQNRELSDAGYLKMRITKELLKAMQWQAEQCAGSARLECDHKRTVEVFIDPDSILKAGTEEA